MKIEIESWQIDEIMEFVSKLSSKMDLHNIHYMISSSCGTQPRTDSQRGVIT
jgi:hypothetical protein